MDLVIATMDDGPPVGWKLVEGVPMKVRDDDTGEPMRPLGGIFLAKRGCHDSVFDSLVWFSAEDGKPRRRQHEMINVGHALCWLGLEICRRQVASLAACAVVPGSVA